MDDVGFNWADFAGGTEGGAPVAGNATEASVVAARRPGPWLQYRVPHGFEWNRYELPVAGLPPQLEGVRVAQITDLHFRKFWSDEYERVLERVSREAPDLILITGDFVESKRNHVPALPTVKRFLAGLRAPLGVFASLGNHDRYALAPRLADCPLTLLDNRRHVIETHGAQIELIGLPGVDRRDVTADVIAAFPPRTFGVPRLVLSHFPDQLSKASALKPDVYFAGHTHGGQICLPGGRILLRHDALPRRLCAGVNRVANTWLVVSRGLGFTTLPLRICCPAEIVEVRLTRG